MTRELIILILNGFLQLKPHFAIDMSGPVRCRINQSMWAERDTERSGAGRKPTWAKRSGERQSKSDCCQNAADAHRY